MLKPRAPLYWLFYLYILDLTLFALTMKQYAYVMLLDNQDRMLISKFNEKMGKKKTPKLELTWWGIIGKTPSSIAVDRVEPRRNLTNSLVTSHIISPKLPWALNIGFSKWIASLVKATILFFNELLGWDQAWYQLQMCSRRRCVVEI